MKIFALRSMRERTLLAAGVFRGCQGVYAVAWVGSSPVTLFRVRVSHLFRTIRAKAARWEADWNRPEPKGAVYGKASW